MRQREGRIRDHDSDMRGSGHAIHGRPDRRRSRTHGDEEARRADAVSGDPMMATTNRPM